MSRYTDTIEEAELLERVAVEGASALQEPEVAEYAAANPEVVARLQTVLGHYRVPLGKNVTIPSLRRGEQPAGYSARYAGLQWRRWLEYGAVATVCSFIAFASWHVFQSKAGNHGSVSEAYPTYTTRPGERANLTIGDTKVFLAPATTLRVKDGVFTLSGHAIFTVNHKTGTPVSVVANGLTTRVLGTVFSVRAYPGEARTRVSVREGRVSVQPGTVTSRRSIVLSTRDEVSVTTGGQAELVHLAKLDDFASAGGRLVLREANVGDAFVELARWYGVEFRTDDSALLAKQITITLPQSLTDGTIRDIADVLGARATRRPGVITFEVNHVLHKPTF